MFARRKEAQDTAEHLRLRQGFVEAVLRTMACPPEEKLLRAWDAVWVPPLPRFASISPEQLLARPKADYLSRAPETWAAGFAVLTDRRFAYYISFTEAEARARLGTPAPGEPPWSWVVKSRPAAKMRELYARAPRPVCVVPLPDFHAVYRIDPDGRKTGFALLTVYGGFSFGGTDSPMVIHSMLRGAVDARRLALGLPRNANPVCPYCGNRGDASLFRCASCGAPTAV